MESIHYDNLQETLYYEVMDNGLHVYVLPKPGFQKTYATFATKYGSVDNHFKVEGESETRVPDGIAHFLEHKMFEEPEGDILPSLPRTAPRRMPLLVLTKRCISFCDGEHP